MYSDKELDLIKTYGIPKKYEILSKFSHKIVRNISFEFGEAPGIPVIYDPPRIIYGGSFYSKNNTSRNGQKGNYELVAEIEDIILQEECKALVVRGESFYGKRAENCINVIYFNELREDVVVWAPTFKELFLELASDESVEDSNRLHYEIMEKVSCKLGELKTMEEKRQINMNEIIEEYSGENSWVVKYELGFSLDSRLYHSIIKSIMISEDIKYPKGEGRKRILKSYYDLVINKMDIDKWEKEYKLWN
ncbi:MAG: hypothetical protein K0R54_4783 [Clostridiaceae bacterium]|jgi:hypothetical protein|nr:hypothetical protein [Clostridiaceae bacterium]